MYLSLSYPVSLFFVLFHFYVSVSFSLSTLYPSYSFDDRYALLECQWALSFSSVKQSNSWTVVMKNRLFSNSCSLSCLSSLVSLSFSVSPLLFYTSLPPFHFFLSYPSPTHLYNVSFMWVLLRSLILVSYRSSADRRIEFVSSLSSFMSSLIFHLAENSHHIYNCSIVAKALFSILLIWRETGGPVLYLAGKRDSYVNKNGARCESEMICVFFIILTAFFYLTIHP